MIVTLHAAVALLTAICGGVLALVVVAGAIRQREARFAVDRLILAGLACVAAGVLLGLVILATGGRPADPLHLLYAAVALLLLPIARFSDRLTRHRALALGIVGVVLVALVVRLYQTG